MPGDLSAFNSELYSLVLPRRAAYDADGFPTAQTRADRIRRVVSLLARNKDRFVTAISDDFGLQTGIQGFHIKGDPALSEFRHNQRSVT